jgi:stearoyl-CoA desaturase (delta-9 desaturase)
MKTPPLAVRRNLHPLGSRVIERSAAQLASSFNAELIVSSIMAAFAGPSLVALQQKLADAQHRAVDVLATFHLPQLPTRQDLLARATAMFAETPSMEDIVNRAHAVILDRIGASLTAALVPVTE